tara:strand:- start:298 stop:531 length:234 start_codon:yes stop_codon:yes gene_type:complete
MYEPNEPHDKWGRPLSKTKPVKQTHFLEKIRDYIFYSVLGLVVIVIFGWLLLICLPYFFGKSVWEKAEDAYIKRLNK